MITLADLGLEELQTRLMSRGFRASHAARLLRAYYEHDGAPPWRNPSLALPGPLATWGEKELGDQALALSARQVAADGTMKLLLSLHDGHSVEAVLMPDFRDDRAAGCISSQVGCAMGCDFCATTKTGFARNLTAGEILAQFFALRRAAKAVGRRLQTVVFMGMGEPMLNLANVLTAIRRMAVNELGALGWRQITVSTVGIVPGIEALAAADLGVHLAVSLHAPDDETRIRLLPTGRHFRVDDILAAAGQYQEQSGRPVTIQYCLLQGVNDSRAQARHLASVLSGRRMHVNLLRYNATGPGLGGHVYTPSDEQSAENFLAELRSLNVVAHFRRPRGRDIDAACGQLRERFATC